MLEGLRKVADAAADVFVAVDGEGDDGDEAECKPGVGLDDGARVVAAVVAATHDTLVSLHLLAERVLAARKYETHGGGLVLRACVRARARGALM